MDRVFLVGLSHKTAPLEVRERLAVPESDLETVVAQLCLRAGAAEAMLVATCNRVEAYVVATDMVVATRSTRSFFTDRAGVDVGSLLYERFGAEAVRHLFMVASSLDSMVIGEPQILGQVKNAFGAAERSSTVGPVLSRCVPRAFGVAKRVRSETAIAHGSVSISSIAVDLARQIFGDLDGRRVLLVGAGKMGETSARQLRAGGAKLTVVNRSYERAQELARACGGDPRPWGDLPQHLRLTDIVISSTAAPSFVITRDMMAVAVRERRHRPLFLIDIAVPRDIDPRVGDLDNIFLFDIDDMQKVVDQNLKERQKEAASASRIVDQEVEAFEAYIRSLDLVPTIVSLRELFTAIGARELERTLPRLKSLTPDERRTLEAMVSAVVAKLLHQPLTELKTAAGRADGPALIEAVQRLFRLGKAGGDTAGAGARGADGKVARAPSEGVANQIEQSPPVPVDGSTSPPDPGAAARGNGGA